MSAYNYPPSAYNYPIASQNYPPPVNDTILLTYNQLTGWPSNLSSLPMGPDFTLFFQSKIHMHSQMLKNGYLLFVAPLIALKIPQAVGKTFKILL
jgi:hypothetical protein